MRFKRALKFALCGMLIGACLDKMVSIKKSKGDE
jgi:hypothetical protein